MSLLVFLSDLRILNSVLVGALGLTFLFNATPRSWPYVSWLSGSAVAFALLNGSARVGELMGWIPQPLVPPLGSMVGMVAWGALVAGLHVFFTRGPVRPLRWFLGAAALGAGVVSAAILLARPWPFGGPLGVSLLFTLTSLGLLSLWRRERWNGLLLVSASFLVHPLMLALALREGYDVAQFRQLTPVPITVAYVFVITLILQRDGQRLGQELRQRQRAEAQLQALADTLEQRVQDRTRQLEELVGGLRSFAGMVSHDLRGPLGNVQGLAALARRALDGGDRERADHHLALIGRESERAMTMVADLLTLARAEQDEPRRAPVAMSRLVDECVQALARQHPRAPEVVRAVGLPEVAIDASLFRHALTNLIGNALKFGADRPDLVVTVGAEREGQGWRFVVADNGPGFDAAQAGRLFQPFERLGATLVPGTGLGLTVVKRVVERHGGRVGAEAEPGRGARFWWTLPDAAATPPSAPA